MAGQKKSAVAKVEEAVSDADKSVAADPPAAAPPTPTKSMAARMLTRSVAGKAPTQAKGKARRATDPAKPSQKPIAGSGSKGPRRGASKGR